MKAIYTDQKTTITAGSTQSIQSYPFLSLSFPSNCFIGSLLKASKGNAKYREHHMSNSFANYYGHNHFWFSRPETQSPHCAWGKLIFTLQRFSYQWNAFPMIRAKLYETLPIFKSAVVLPQSKTIILSEWCREFYRDKFGRCSKLGPLFQYRVASSVTVSSLQRRELNVEVRLPCKTSSGN